MSSCNLKIQLNIRYSRYYTRDIKKGKEEGKNLEGKNFLPGAL